METKATTNGTTESTSGTSSSLALNIGVLKTPSALLKLFETIIGTICFGIMTYAIAKITKAMDYDYDYDDDDYTEIDNGDNITMPENGDNNNVLNKGDNIKAFVFYLTTVVFLLTTFLLLVSSLVSDMAAKLIPKTIFELLYHIFAFLFYLVSSLMILVLVSEVAPDFSGFARAVSLPILGLTNAVLYGLSAYFSYKSYKSS